MWNPMKPKCHKYFKFTAYQELTKNVYLAIMYNKGAKSHLIDFLLKDKCHTNRVTPVCLPKWNSNLRNDVKEFILIVFNHIQKHIQYFWLLLIIK